MFNYLDLTRMYKNGLELLKRVQNSTVLHAFRVLQVVLEDQLEVASKSHQPLSGPSNVGLCWGSILGILIHKFCQTQRGTRFEVPGRLYPKVSV